MDYEHQAENWPIEHHLYKSKFSPKNKTCSYTKKSDPCQNKKSGIEN